MRKINWDKGNPYVWRETDFNALVNSKYLFARKFDVEIDKKIVDKISNYIKK